MISSRYFTSSSALSTSTPSTPTSSANNALNICILVGSTRTEGPPRPILSNRVTQYVQSSIKSRQAKHTISIINAKEVPLMTKPHFAYAKSQLPDNLASMHTTLQNSDAYITITPEYNHSPCPGLMNLMNHFGSSTFSFKPSGIVSYSSGQWGGTRAAHSLRPFLTELGCLPVSAMVNIPNAMNVLDEEGNVINVEEEERWGKYLDRMIYQVEFWANAAKNQRYLEDPTKGSPAFVTSPSERNAPN